MGFTEKLIGVITVPGETFKHITEKDLRKGFIIIFIIAILSAWAGASYFSKIEVGPEFSNIRPQMTPFIAIANSIRYLTRWLVPSLLLGLFAKVMIGEGSVRRLLAMTSFASIPLLLQQVLRVIDSQIISSMELKEVVASNFTGEGFVTRFLNQGLTVFNVFGFLTLVLTVFAVRENYDSSTMKATQVTVIVYLLYVLIRVFLPLL